MVGTIKMQRLLGLVVYGILSAAAIPVLAQDQTSQSPGVSRGVRILAAPTPDAGDPSQMNVPGLEAVHPSPLSPALSSPPSEAPQPPSASVLLAPPKSQSGLGTKTSAPALLTPAPALTSTEFSNSSAPVGAPSNAALGSGAVAHSLNAPYAPLLQPALPPAPSGVAPSNQAPGTNDVANAPIQPDSGAFSSRLDPSVTANLSMPNSAGISMQIHPGRDIPVGSRVSFEVSSKQPGYLILVDIDTTGKLVQIYPNPMSLMLPTGPREMSNYLRPGKVFSIPDQESAYSGFEFVTSPPAGTALVVAILSDRPVQMIDLPDIPGNLIGEAAALDYLTKLAGELRIPSTNGQLEEAHWSFDATFYAIR